MATLRDLDALALAMPDTVRASLGDDRFEYVVGGKKSLCRHREERKDAIDPDTGERMRDVLMFRTPSLEARDVLLETHPEIFFITDHFAGYPAALTRIPRLAALSRDDLDDIVVEAWLAVAPKRAAKAWLAEQDAAD
ncbi:MAG: hypothetical protein AAGC46_13100 [Solirubrobacteraceae bacterium]|nr:hypothetical protein [Patulibacter sp.]